MSDINEMSGQEYLEWLETRIAELTEKLAAAEVAINTVIYCYDKRPENFSLALSELQQLAIRIRPQPPKV
jgi:hypothetical protein